ncbi:MAG TPA: ribose ABC transporter permease, partial [Bacillota bacterium]|nr:ribose ABC transporter permease [Bacillota bacterium]
MRLAAQILKYSRLLIIAALFVGLTLASPVFLTGSNLINVVRQTALLAVLGFAMTLVILVGGI